MMAGIDTKGIKMQYINKWSIQLVKESSYKVESKSITCPDDVIRIIAPHFDGKPKEEFIVLLLNTKNNVIGINTVSVGTVDTSIVHPREVFQPALLANATSIILAHNHPSGNTEPSDEDLKVTNRLIMAGNILGIDVLDHVIYGDGVGLSLKVIGKM